MMPERKAFVVLDDHGKDVFFVHHGTFCKDTASIMQNDYGDFKVQSGRSQEVFTFAKYYANILL